MVIIKTWVEKGMRLEQDVVSLLSNGGKRGYLVRNNGVKVAVDSLAGKYLLICCLKLPCHDSSIQDFEMMMVAKMVSATLMVVGGDEEAAFNRFFYAFPCLAISFCDTEPRDFLCKSLGFGLTYPGKQDAALVLDPVE